MEKNPIFKSLTEFLIKQRQAEDMEFASNWEEGEDERRDKLEKLQEEYGFPYFTEPDEGFAEVEEENTLPWNANESGIPRKQK